MHRVALAACLALTSKGGALAGKAAVLDATLTPSVDGAVLGARTLLHPHETEQPFTRSLSGVAIPEDVGEVTIRAHASVHGYGGQELTVGVPRE